MGIQIINGLTDHAICGAHSDDDFFCIWASVVVKQVVISSGDLVDLCHVVLNDLWNCLVIWVCCLTVLEINIRVLNSTSLYRTLWIQGSLAECL